jgi:hypothetical protein
MDHPHIKWIYTDSGKDGRFMSAVAIHNITGQEFSHAAGKCKCSCSQKEMEVIAHKSPSINADGLNPKVDVFG